MDGDCQMKKCPFCAEEIQDAAIKCKHCGSMLGKRNVEETPIPTSTSSKTSKHNKPSPASLGCAVLILIALILGVSFCSSTGSKGSSDAKPKQTSVHTGDRGYLNVKSYVAATKKDLDLMLDFINAKNNNGLTEMLLSGKIFILEKNTEVNVIDSGFAILKISSSNGTGWVPVEFVSKK